MTTDIQKQPDDAATAPITGIIFQFEKALALLSTLGPADSITIEKVDDVATHDADDSVLATFQAKYSMSASGSAFEDTSRALWRTFQIWINKLENGTFTQDTIFTCSTNQKIPEEALVRFISAKPFEEVLTKLSEILKTQKAKLKTKEEKQTTSGKSIASVIKLIKFAIDKKEWFEIIKNNIAISDEENVRKVFFNAINANADQISTQQRTRIYHEFNGWITDNCAARWKNDVEAKFTKLNFDNKLHQITSNSSIMNAIFRTKALVSQEPGTATEAEVEQKKSELFVKQIEDIDRRKDAKEKIIRNAILDFIYYGIEMKHIVDRGDYTQPDFDEFVAQCRVNWGKVFDMVVVDEPASYDDKQKNDLAREVFDTVMNKIQLEFKEGFCFNPTTEYFRNGCFLELSNIPEIGWHPEWESKYKP